MTLHSPETDFEIGVDESGRGTLWGNVVAAAVILPAQIPDCLLGLNDSKKLSAKKRDDLSKKIKEHAIAWSIGEATSEEIDQVNILQATMLAMNRALNGLGKDLLLYKILIDGCYFKPQPPTVSHVNLNYRCIPKGDSLHMNIAAASILAKEHRDASVNDSVSQEPELKHKWNLHKNKGYGTKAHIDSIKIHGIHRLHRKTFRPICDLLF